MADSMRSIGLVLTKDDTDALHEVDATFARLLQVYRQSRHALVMSEQDGADELTLLRRHKEYDLARDALARFFRDLT